MNNQLDELIYDQKDNLTKQQARAQVHKKVYYARPQDDLILDIIEIELENQIEDYIRELLKSHTMS